MNNLSCRPLIGHHYTCEEGKGRKGFRPQESSPQKHRKAATILGSNTFHGFSTWVYCTQKHYLATWTNGTSVCFSFSSWGHSPLAIGWSGETLELGWIHTSTAAEWTFSIHQSKSSLFGFSFHIRPVAHCFISLPGPPETAEGRGRGVGTPLATHFYWLNSTLHLVPPA